MRIRYYSVFIVVGVLLGLAIIVIAGDKGPTAVMSTAIDMLALFLIVYVTTICLLLKYQTIPYCTMMLKVNSKSAIFFSIRGTAYLRRGEYELALQDLQSCIKIKPKRVISYINRGVAHLATRKYEQALEDFNYAQQLAPSRATVYLGRGMVYSTMRRYQEALQDFDRVLTLPFRALFAGAYMGKAVVYVHLKDYQQVLQECERAVVLAPRKAEPYYTRGMAYLFFVHCQEALQDFEYLMKVSSPSAKTMMWYGGMTKWRVVGHICCATACIGLKEYQVAFDHLEQAIVLDPQCAHAYYVRGITSLWLNDMERARIDIEQSWKMNVLGCSYGLVLAWLDLCQVKPNQDIRERLEAIGAMDEVDYCARVSRGVVQWIQGNHEEALVTLQQDIDTESEAVFAYFWSGMVCASLGRDDEAVAMIEHSLEQHLPPALLAPLRWLEEENLPFYQYYTVSLLDG